MTHPHGAALGADPPVPRRPWPRRALRTVRQLPGRLALRVVATARGIVAYARARPLAFSILFAEFLVSIYFLSYAGHQLYLRLVAKGIISTSTAAAVLGKPVEVALSTFLQHAQSGVAKEVVLAPGKATYVADVAALGGSVIYASAAAGEALQAAASKAIASGTHASQRLFAYTLNATPALVDRLIAAGIPFRVAHPSFFGQLAPRFFLIAYCGFLFWMVRRMFGDSGAKTMALDASRVRETFEDVAGLAEAKASVSEVVTILRNPSRYQAVGARIPSGLLLVGPPGGGKTLLARCLAGEAGVPFYSCSGSDFVEVFAGRGASRVRALFAKATATAPSVVFIDELDALGKKRAMRISSNNEDDQTLNQLLAAMDGFDTSNNGVVVVGATNRYNLLDEALTRPGRFDRIVRVDLPNAADREAILRVHLRRKAVAPSVGTPQLRRLAELTNNFSGAALAAVANEAAIGAVRRGATVILMEDLEAAVAQYRQSRGGSLFGDLF